MAALNQTVNAYSSIANNAFLTIQPPSTEEWVVFNIYAPVGTSTELYVSDGTTDTKIDTDNTGGWRNYKFNVANDQFLKVKNVSGSAAYLGFDGRRAY
jgi:hypothetical protein